MSELFTKADFAQAVRTELVTKADLAQAIETQTLRITVRLGVMLVAAIGLLSAVMKLA